MSARIKVDLTAGVLEVEGSEEFVQTVYSDFKTRVTIGTIAAGAISPKATPISTTSSRSRKRSGEQREAYQIVKDLNLVPKGKQSLRDFISQFQPASNMEWNAVFVYYLESVVEIRPITPAHVFTCYRDAKLPIPKALPQSLIDTSSRKGWLNTSTIDDIRLTVGGTNFVEHELAKSAEAE
jgi:hypothetical protein